MSDPLVDRLREAARPHLVAPALEQLLKRSRRRRIAVVVGAPLTAVAVVAAAGTLLQTPGSTMTLAPPPAVSASPALTTAPSPSQGFLDELHACLQRRGVPVERGTSGGWGIGPVSSPAKLRELQKACAAELGVQWNDQLPSASPDTPTAEPTGQRYMLAMQSCLEDRGLTVRRQSGRWSITARGGTAAAVEELRVTCRTSLNGLEQANPALGHAQGLLAQLACMRVGEFAVSISNGPRTVEDVPVPRPPSGGPPVAAQSNPPGTSLGYGIVVPPGATDSDVAGVEQACSNAMNRP